MSSGAAYLKLDEWDLVNVRDVALPVYRLTIDAVVIKKQVLPRMSEFVLRAIEMGFCATGEISAVLGIEAADAEAPLVLLLAEGLVTVKAGPGGAEVLSVTTAGNSLLRGEMVETVEVSMNVDYDGLTREPVESRGWLKRPRDVRNHGWYSIAPAPSRPPLLSELDVAAVARATGSGVRQHLAGIARIIRRELLFLPAELAVYRRKAAAEQARVAIFVDGRERPDYANALSRSGRIDRLGIPDESEPALPALGKWVGQHLDKEAKSLRVDPADFASGWAVLETYDHPDLLDDALANSLARLIIVSPWITPQVMDEERVSQLRLLLERSVDVFIGWGLGDRQPFEVITQLEDLSRRYRNFRFHHFGSLHMKGLVSDDRFAVLTSFNWLSFRGDPDRAFRDERGMKVTNPAAVEVIAASLLKPFPS